MDGLRCTMSMVGTSCGGPPGLYEAESRAVSGRTGGEVKPTEEHCSASAELPALPSAGDGSADMSGLYSPDSCLPPPIVGLRCMDGGGFDDGPCGAAVEASELRELRSFCGDSGAASVEGVAGCS